MARPELPPDPDPADPGRDLKRDKRKRRRPEDPDGEDQEPAEPDDEAVGDSVSEPEPEVMPEDPERIRREVAADLAFRERVALRELADRLPPESYRAVEHALAGTSLEWRLEKGRYLFTYLVGERTVEVDDRPVRVEQKLAISRDAPPADPEVIERRIAELVSAEASPQENARRLEGLCSELAPEDEVRVAVAPDQPEIIVTAEAVTVGEPPEPPLPASEVPEPQPETLRHAIAAAAEVSEEDAAPPEPAPASPDSPPAVEAPEAQEVPIGPEAATSGIAAALEILDREAVSLNDLPPIAGGAPEADEIPVPEGPEEPEEPELPVETPTEVPEEPAEPAELPPAGPTEPAERDTRPRQRSRRRLPDIFNWEPGWTEVVRRPDHAMRQSARKLARRMAAEYGLKLTPDLEAYLVSIILRPRRIGGRLVYGVGLNLERLVSVLQVLKYNFNFTHRPPAA